MKWFAALLIGAGIVSVMWTLKQDKTADLSILPIVVIAGFGGAGMTIIGVVWIVVIAFTAA